MSNKQIIYPLNIIVMQDLGYFVNSNKLARTHTHANNFFLKVRNASVSNYEPTHNHRLVGSRQTASVRVVRNGP
jgi:hypothetical protein